MNILLGLSKYATKPDLKGATVNSRSALTSDTDLTRIKNKLENLDECKLKSVHVVLNKLSNEVNNDVVKKTCV